MKEIFQRILNMELEAQAIQQDADRLQAQLDDLRQKEEEIKARSMENARARIAKRRAELEEVQARDCAAIRAQTSEESARLERLYAEQREQWVNALYRKAVGAEQ